MDSTNCETLLDSLNEDCLLMIFKLLAFEDLMSVAETCTKFKDITYTHGLFKQHSTFEYTFPLDPKRVSRFSRQPGPNMDVISHIDRILKHTGHHITSLDINCFDEYPCSRLLNRIDRKKLKQLKFRHLSPSCLAAFSSQRFDNLESLTLTSTDHGRTALLRTTLLHLKKLKQMIFLYADMKLSDLKMMLRNNPDLETVVLFGADGAEFDFQILELIPKVKKLAFHVAQSDKFNVPPALDYLTTLQINCEGATVNKFLQNLSQKPLLKELELHSVPLDGLFPVITEFVNLEVLHLCCCSDGGVSSSILDGISSIDLPPHIKQLLLHTIARLNPEACLTTIRKLESLERFDGHLNFGARNADVAFQKIGKLLDNRKQKLHLAVPLFDDNNGGGGDDDGRQRSANTRHRMESAQLKILNNNDEYNQMGIHATFPVTPRRILNCEPCGYLETDVNDPTNQ